MFRLKSVQPWSTMIKHDQAWSPWGRKMPQNTTRCHKSFCHATAGASESSQSTAASCAGPRLCLGGFGSFHQAPCGTSRLKRNQTAPRVQRWTTATHGPILPPTASKIPCGRKMPIYDKLQRATKCSSELHSAFSASVEALKGWNFHKTCPAKIPSIADANRHSSGHILTFALNAFALLNAWHCILSICIAFRPCQSVSGSLGKPNWS